MHPCSDTSALLRSRKRSVMLCRQLSASHHAACKAPRRCKGACSSSTVTSCSTFCHSSSVLRSCPEVPQASRTGKKDKPEIKTKPKYLTKKQPRDNRPILCNGHLSNRQRNADTSVVSLAVRDGMDLTRLAQATEAAQEANSDSGANGFTQKRHYTVQSYGYSFTEFS